MGTNAEELEKRRQAEKAEMDRKVAERAAEKQRESEQEWLN